MENAIFNGAEAWLPAWSFAAEVHATQTMPGNDHSYLRHLGAVTLEILAAHSESALPDLNLAVICAMLHDAMEDQHVTYETINSNFGKAVADGVLALTKRADLPKTEAMADSLARIRQQPHAVWCVKMADRISNLSNIPAHWSPEKAANYSREAEAIFLSLGEAHAPLAERLKQKISRYLK